MDVPTQLFWLFTLPLPIACIAWTVTQEEIFKELKVYCTESYKSSTTIIKKKFFYLLTCEYCFSHYVTLLFLFLTKFKLLLDDWVGYLIAGFALVWIANIYMSLYAFIKQDIKREKTQIGIMDKMSDL